MDKRIVFTGDLMHMASSIDEAIAELTLPAMPWALKDAIERAHLDDGEPMYIDLADYTDFPYLEPYLEDANDLYALNALTEKLAALEPWQMDALEGLVLMEKEKHEPFGLPRIFDLAASAGECQVLYEATSDEVLGRFYVDNGFVPETEDLPEALYALLDYAKIGEKMREGEGGVFLRYGSGYVTQVGDLKEEFKFLDLTPKVPGYSALLEVAVPDTDRKEMLSLPCGREGLDSLLDRLEVNGWSKLTWRCADCRVPDLRDAFSMTDNILYVLSYLSDNVYADYDLEHGLVADTLLLILHRGDGTDRQHEYPLSPEEQALLLPKMEVYCLEQTGLSLAEYRSQYLAQGQETQGVRTEPTM